MSIATTTAPTIGVSSWALHQELGEQPIYGVEWGERVPDHTPTSSKLSLLELPAALARQGFDTIQICHFHLPSRDAAYLARLKEAIQSSGLSLHALLVDEGDITHPENGERDEAWIRGWIPVAAQLGAQQIRVIAGKTNRAGAIEHSARVLKSLAADAAAQNVSILTENWFDVLSTPAAVHELLERCDGETKFLLDFSNWGGTGKYDDLAHIATFASSCHVQVTFFDANHIDEDDFTRCLQLPYPDTFNGPFVLVNGGLDGVGLLRDFIRAQYAQP
jgi:hypothetical protein